MVQDPTSPVRPQFEWRPSQFDEWDMMWPILGLENILIVLVKITNGLLDLFLFDKQDMLNACSNKLSAQELS